MEHDVPTNGVESEVKEPTRSLFTVSGEASYISRLSDDILQNIFESLSGPVPHGPMKAQGEYHTEVRYRGPLASQITISHVCQRWRRVSLGTATLWNRFGLDNPADIPVIEQLIRERAKDMVLELTVLDLHPFYEPRPEGKAGCYSPLNRELGTALQGFLTTYLPRTRNLSLWGCQLTMPPVFEHELPLTETLERLELVLIPFSHCDGTDLVGPQPGFPKRHAYIPLRAPNLRTLNLDRLRMDTARMLDSSTLQTLSMQKPSGMCMPPEGFECLADLAHLPNLEHLQYSLAIRDTTSVFWADPRPDVMNLRWNEIGSQKVDLPRLKSFDMWCDRTTTKARLQFFQQLNMPVLKSLTLRKWDSFFSPTAAANQDLVSIVQLLPSIRRLGLEIPWPALGAFVERLKNSHEDVLLPRLQSLVIQELVDRGKEPTSPPSEVTSNLEELVLARNVSQGFAPLDELWLSIAPPEGWAERLHNLGCQVKVQKLTRLRESWWRFPVLCEED